MSEDRLKYLFQRYFYKNCTPEEKEELFGLSLETDMDDLLRKLIYEAWNTTGQEEGLSDSAIESVIQKILGKPEQPIIPGKVVRLNLLKRWTVAASIILLVGLGSYLFFFRKQQGMEGEMPIAAISHDVKAPAINRAMITLANGKKIFLDSAANGTLAIQNNINIIKTNDGKIEYSEASNSASKSGEGIKEGVYNTLTNPRGSKVIDMVLSDGSHVWLDAGSSLTYPVAFVGNPRMGSYGERKVFITGQAYFEVKHNEKMPFTVSANGVEIHDIGTAFNVNAYDDEDAIRVTLLEGSVKVSSISSPSPKERDGVRLKPGEQAIVADHSRLTIDHSPDLDQIMAWKNGKFDFGASTDIKSIMRQIARWYNVEIQYKDNVQESFAGGISREVNVSEVLKNFELTGRVHFSIESNKIIVKK